MCANVVSIKIGWMVSKSALCFLNYNSLKNLLDSQQHVTKEVEETRLKINILNQHVEDLKHQLKVFESVLETKAALSAPLSY